MDLVQEMQRAFGAPVGPWEQRPGEELQNWVARVITGFFKLVPKANKTSYDYDTYWRWTKSNLQQDRPVGLIACLLAPSGREECMAYCAGHVEETRAIVRDLQTKEVLAAVLLYPDGSVENLAGR